MRHSYAESPPRVEYELTDEGRGAPADHRRDAPLRARVARRLRALSRSSAARGAGRAPSPSRSRAACTRASSRSFGEWMLLSGEREAGDDRRDALVDERRHDRQRAAGADEQRAAAHRLLEGVRAELHRLRVGRHEARRPRTRAARTLELGALGRGLAQQPLDRGRDLLDVLAGREPDREVRLGRDRQHRLLQDAASRPRSRSRRARARRSCAGRTPRPPSASTGVAPGVGEHLRARRRARPRRRAPRRSAARSRRAAAPAGGRPRGWTAASVCISACVAFSAAPPNRPECRSRSPVRTREVEVDEPARRDRELGHAARRHAAVEDQRRVGAALVGGEEVDDRVAAGLLLAVAGEADVDRQLAGGRELAPRPSASM